MCRRLCLAMIVLSSLMRLPTCAAEELLFEDRFEGTLSSKWQRSNLNEQDIRLRNGGLELRIRVHAPNETPLIKVDLPFTTAGPVRAAVDVSLVDKRLSRGEFAGICLTVGNRPSFRGKKTNIDGYVLFSPGHVEFIGEAGQEGDPAKYTVKYWPADDAAGPLNIIIRGNYAHFQVGPSKAGEYQTFFHSAVAAAESGLGFGLIAGGTSAETNGDERWVRFDNFRVSRP